MELKKIGVNDIKLQLHLGNTNSDFKASTIRRMHLREGSRGHLLYNNYYAGKNQHLIASEEFFQSMEEFVDHMQRSASHNTYRSHSIGKIHEYYDYFHIISDVIAEKIIEAEITHILFFNIPHLAFDTITHHVAKAMGIPCLMVTQSLFPNRFFSMRSPEHNGEIENGGARNKKYEIAKGEPFDLFYMKGIKQQAGKSGSINAKGILQLMVYLYNKKPFSAFNPLYLYRTLKRMNKIYGSFPDWRDPFARFFHEDSLAYFEHMAQFEDQALDLNRRFVYFPLQLQPEMTTSALGRAFVDQALAIEQLSLILPPDVWIYVKENPKQGAFMRGPMFFHRLSRVKSVVILSSHADTHALQNAAECVVTITGTAAWESVCKGKRALVFGDAWHQSLPGVIKWRSDLTYDEILNTEVDHEALEYAVGNLLEKSHQGVVDRHYEKLVSDFDAEKNCAESAQIILDLLLEKRAPTFGPSHAAK
jgi:Capsule polysaccharide biosynthesis protein